MENAHLGRRITVVPKSIWSLMNPWRITAIMTTIPVPQHPERDLRQRALVPPDQLAACHAVVIGVGAIGRQVALQLAALGMPLIVLYDHDIVAEENLAPQGYRPDQLGLTKADATAADCQRIYPGGFVIPRNERFRRSTGKHAIVGQRAHVVFCCVDSIRTRRLVWESLRFHAALFLDGRMSAEVIRALAVDSPSRDNYYPSTLFDADEAYAGACTARSTIYTAAIAAGLMVGQMTKWLRYLPVDPDLTLNLLATELTAQGPSGMPAPNLMQV
jgi:sulfur carrier protein ThiS adenylyltransferase